MAHFAAGGGGRPQNDAVPTKFSFDLHDLGSPWLLLLLFTQLIDEGQ